MSMFGLATILLYRHQKIIDTEGRVERFLRKYGMAVPVLLLNLKKASHNPAPGLTLG